MKKQICAIRELDILTSDEEAKNELPTAHLPE